MSAQSAFDFESIDEAWLRAKPGQKWHFASPRLAAWVADMDFRPAPVILDHLRSLLDGGDIGYPDRKALGKSRTTLAFVDRMQQLYDWSIDVGDVREWNDVVQSIQAFLHVICTPGDRIITHTPAYPPFFSAITQANCEIVPVPAHISGDTVTFDHDALDATLAATPAGVTNKVLLLCNPQNPTGHVFTRAELEHLVDIAKRHNLIIISDEIHSDLVYDNHRHIPIASIPGAADRTITLTSASKSFNIAGLHYSVSHCGVPDVEARLAALPDHLFGGEPNLMGAEAAWASWTMGEDWFTAVRAHLQTMRDTTIEMVREQLPRVTVHRPDATYLAWLDCRDTPIAADPHAAFAAAGVEVSSGVLFDPVGGTGDGHVRFNFATSTAMLERLIGAMSGALR